MKKFVFILIAIFAITFVSCDGDFSTQSRHIDPTYNIMPVASDDSIIDTTGMNDPYYLLTLQIKQSTFTLDIGEHIKNKANAIEMTIAVDKRFYNSVQVGEEISNSFKMGSLVFDGDFSSLKVRVKSKQIVNK